MANFYYDVGEEIEIVEGDFEGERGVIVAEFRSNFGKQFLDVQIRGSLAFGQDEPTVVRKRAADVRRP